MHRHWPLVLLLLAVICASPTNAMDGNELPEYISCLDTCTSQQCSNNNMTTLPLYLRLAFWTCPENCQYECMIKTVDDTGLMVQYYGKWPFYRLWGIQEPASVFFSVANGCMHYLYLRIISKKIPSSYYLRPFIIAYALVNINTWVQSSIFHSRDLPLTEKLDYFSAFLVILYSVYYAILRIFCIDERSKQKLIGAALLVVFIAHVSFMSFVSFHYVYNMVICGIFAVIQGAMWVLWYLVAYYTRNKQTLSYGHWVIYATVANALAVMFEVFDFPPIGRVFDAHSLWHLSTIAVAPLWYHFVIQDSLNESTWSVLPQSDVNLE
ncbi:Per1-like-domain-containing protein [Fennellomyces sp. T-0311]|nr:Per1-like-domain-containing protein [Fennellomyces sp. T-0311]